MVFRDCSVAWALAGKIVSNDPTTIANVITQVSTKCWNEPSSSLAGVRMVLWHVCFLVLDISWLGAPWWYGTVLLAAVSFLGNPVIAGDLVDVIIYD
jgi:hypothetical protein